MKMRFPLATLLHLRKLREEQEHAKLSAANLKKAKMQQAAERVESLLNDALRVSACGDGSTCGAQMRFVGECCTVLEIHERRAKERAEQAKADALKQEKMYLAAHRDFEMLESFREKQMQMFRMMERRQEQRELDEAHLLVRVQRSGQALPIRTADVAEGTGTANETISQGNIGRKE